MDIPQLFPIMPLSDHLLERGELYPIEIKFDLTGTHAILLALFDIIEKNIESEGIYRKACNARDLNRKYDAIESEELADPKADPEIDTSPPDLACSLAKRIIRELPESKKIPFDVFGDFLNKTNKEKEVLTCHFLNGLELDDRSFLIFILAHLRKVAKNEELNKMNIKNLAIIFSPTLFQSTFELNQLELQKEILESLIEISDKLTIKVCL